MSNDTKPPINIRLKSLVDLARMLASRATREMTSNILYFEHKSKHIFGTMINNQGYYNWYGIPYWIYSKEDSPPETPFLAYEIRPKEKISWVETLEDPTKKYFPIIFLSQKIEILNIE